MRQSKQPLDILYNWSGNGTVINMNVKYLMSSANWRIKCQIQTGKKYLFGIGYWILDTGYSCLRQEGFTYIELILYIAIITIMMTTLIPFAWNVIEGGAKSATEREVFSQGRYVSERLEYEIRNASGINSVSSNQISLSETNPATNPTIITLNSGNITIQQGVANPVAINSQNTTISNLTFANYTSADNKTKNIQFVFTINANYPGAGSRQEYKASVAMEGDAEVLSN